MTSMLVAVGKETLHSNTFCYVLHRLAASHLRLPGFPGCLAARRPCLPAQLA